MNKKRIYEVIEQVWIFLSSTCFGTVIFGLENHNDVLLFIGCMQLVTLCYICYLAISKALGELSE